MKLKVSKKNRERYETENSKITAIRKELMASNMRKARELLEQAFNETEFKTKFNEPEKDLTKYCALKVLEEPPLSNEILYKFIQDLWEKKDASLREIGIFLLGHLYSIDPKRYFKHIIELAMLCNTWNDIDNLAGYTIEEHVAKDYDDYLERFQTLITHENQWVRRLVIVSLGRGFFISKNKHYVEKCFEVIELSFTDSRKIVLDANSWIIGTLAMRINPKEVTRCFQKYRASDNPIIIKLFCDVVKRSKLAKTLPVELKAEIIISLDRWRELDQSKTRRSVDSALKFLKE